MTDAHRIEGRAKTIRELMDRAKYTIDFYQREYAGSKAPVAGLRTGHPQDMTVERATLCGGNFIEGEGQTWQ